jgi:L-asparaginase
MTRIALISTGGTIDSVGSSRLDHAHYTEHRTRLSAGELLAALPEVLDVADVEEVPFRRVPSYALTAADWAALAGEADRLFAQDIAGLVITHGTNTIEETAFALHLTVTSPKPVVLVGAMRPTNALAADGPLNLLDAVRVAAAPAARGVVVVLNQTIHAAAWVTKTTTVRADAFGSPETGPIGRVGADGRVDFHSQPLDVGGSEKFHPNDLLAMPRVDIITSHVGADGALIDAAVAAGAQGIVIAGTGAGRCTPGQDEAVDRAIAAGVAVCQATRVGAGRVSRSPQMRDRGLLTAEALVPWKARILLGLGLTRTRNVEELHAYFSPV